MKGVNSTAPNSEKQMKDKAKIGEFPSELQYLTTQNLTMTVEDGISEMVLNLDIEVTGKIGDVKIDKIKFQKQHKFNTLEMLKILTNNPELDIGLKKETDVIFSV